MIVARDSIHLPDDAKQQALAILRENGSLIREIRSVQTFVDIFRQRVWLLNEIPFVRDTDLRIFGYSTESPSLTNLFECYAKYLRHDYVYRGMLCPTAFNAFDAAAQFGTFAPSGVYLCFDHEDGSWEYIMRFHRDHDTHAIAFVDRFCR